MAASRRQDAAFWISYSDLATGLLLIFILLVAITMNQQAKARQELETDKEEVQEVQEEIEKLLGQRNVLAQRLESASREANRVIRASSEIRNDVFVYVPEDQMVEVRLDTTEIAWFRQGGADLDPRARPHLRAFYRALYTQMMCVRTETDPTPTCEPGQAKVPDFLDAIEISGHTDPITLASGEPSWSWGAFNGTGARSWKDGNLRLAQDRSKAIVDAIQSFYEEDAGRAEDPMAITDVRYPWRPLLALVHTSGRAWMEAYCAAPGGIDEKLTPERFFDDPPCVYTRDDAEALYRRSRRVSFSFRLDDRAILQRLQALAERVAELGGASVETR
ncbi:MAG: hypothetical protein H6732_17060 [Alphaproteobacteria bacterium]|nr:hypothetical protein [Alphaproteobacteria bacterium]